MIRIARQNLFVSFAAALVAASPVSAAILAPGATVFPAGTTAAQTPVLLGDVEASASTSVDFNPDPLFLQGYTFETEVRSSDAGGATVLSHRLANPTNTFPSFLYIDAFSLDGYSDFETDVFFRTDGPGDRAPTFVERSADGDVLDFTFALPLVNGFLTQQPQEESFAIEILTNANSFENTGRLTVFGRLLGNVTESVEFSVGGIPVPSNTGFPIGSNPPRAGVPAPTPALLLLTGLVGLTGARRLRRTATPSSERPNPRTAFSRS